MVFLSTSVSVTLSWSQPVYTFLFLAMDAPVQRIVLSNGFKLDTDWWVGTMEFYFPFHIWDNPSKIDELICFKMVIAPPTRICFIFQCLI